MIKVSVIIPSKNRFEFTSQALSFVYSQNQGRKLTLEVIVVDDLSSPTLKSILGKKFPKTIFINNSGKNHGPGASRNVGIKYATGDYFAFLDNDDQWSSKFLINSIDNIKISKCVASLCLTKEFFDGNFSIYYRVKIKLLNEIRFVILIICYIIYNKKLPRSGFYLTQISHMVFDAGVVRNLRFNELTAAAEDWEYVVNSTKNHQVQIIPKKLVKFRYEPGSSTHSEVVRKNKWQAYKSLLENIPNTHKKGILHKLFLKYIWVFQG